MGSGKTHWGQIWAARHKLAFLDLDEAIENIERKSVVDIFESKGEAYFRSVEEATLKSCAELSSTTIVACGGGTSCYMDNLKWMNAYGITIYLQCTPAEILRRLLKGQLSRPLIKKLNQAELLFFIEQKLKEREPLYNKCNIIIDNASISEHTFEEVILPY
jgi:shikimate kinase